MSRPALKVMISSRVVDTVAFQDGTSKTMAVIRKELKASIEALRIGGEKLFEVWINEDAPAASGDDTSWEHCMEQARTADIVLSLFNGNAGWASSGGDIGICHAELETALHYGRGRVRLIKLPECGAGATGDAKVRNERFNAYVSAQNLFRAEARRSGEVKDVVEAALRDAVIDLSRRGKTAAKADKHDRGPALEWSRLSFIERHDAMVKSAADALKGRSGVVEIDGATFRVPLGKDSLVVRVAAMPGAMSVAEAREMVGRPHLRDHELTVHLKSRADVGPLHMIVCHRSATETGGLNILGFPDAVVVASGFGLYLADNVEKSQLVFLRECRDDTTVRHALHLFFDWLEHSGEADRVAERARGRKAVATAVAKLHQGTP